MKGDKDMQILGQYQDKFEQITDHSDWEKKHHRHRAYRFIGTWAYSCW